MIVITRSNGVNPDPRVEKVINFLKKTHNVHVIAWNREGDSFFQEEKNVKFSRIGIKAGFGNGMMTLIPLIKWNIKLLLTLLKNRKSYKVIHACDFDTILPALIMKFLFRKKIIYDIFDFYVDSFSVPSFLKNIIKKIDFLAINKCDYLIIASESRMEQIKGSVPKKVCVINNIPEINDNIKDLTISNKKNIISYIGILQKHRSLEVMKKLTDTLPDWEFHIAGFGILEDLFKNHKYFYGKVNYDKAMKINSMSKLLFAMYSPEIPNHHYSDPNKFYEALSLGRPILVSSNMYIKNIVEKYNVGYIVEYDNQDEILKVLEDVQNNTATYNEKCKNAATLYKEKYNWNEMENRLREVYNTVGINVI